MDHQKPVRRVLIVDREKGSAENLADALQGNGVETALAGDLAEALDLLAAFRPHCALIDFNPDRGPGIDLLSALKEKIPAMPFILMTTNASTDAIIEAFREGAYDYLRKPIEGRHLLVTLDRCFGMLRLLEERNSAHEALEKRNEELAQINARLRRMVESARELTSCSDVKELSRHLLEEFASLMAAEGGSLYMVHEVGLELIHCLEEGSVPEWIAFPLKKGSVCDHVLRSLEPVLSRDISEDDYLPSGSASYKEGSFFALPLIGQDGEAIAIITLHNKKWPPFTSQDKEIGQVMLSLSNEILRSKQAADQIRISLQEKDMLLKEVHHRVKNNLQVISGLLNLQANNVADDQARNIYKNSQNRINTMALIHENIYNTKDLNNVHFSQFVRDLTVNLMKIYHPDSDQIRLELDIQDVEMVADTAIPCGLIINELCTNALQYAFPENSLGLIHIEFKEPESGYYHLKVSDDGIGLPSCVDFHNTRTMGIQLVRILSEQLDSETTVVSDAGTAYSFRFREYHEAGTNLY